MKFEDLDKVNELVRRNLILIEASKVAVDNLSGDSVVTINIDGDITVTDWTTAVLRNAIIGQIERNNETLQELGLDGKLFKMEGDKS